MLNRMKDLKKKLGNENTMSYVHPYHSFKFFKCEGQVKLQVKKYSNEAWVNIEGELLAALTHEDTDSDVVPQFQELDKFEASLDQFVEGRFLSSSQIDKLRTEVRDIKRGETAMWSFDNLGKYTERRVQTEIISPLVVNSVEEATIPRPPLISNRRIQVTKRHVYPGDLIVYFRQGAIHAGTVKEIFNRQVEILPWNWVDSRYQICTEPLSISREEIMASGLRFNGERKFQEKIQMKLDALLEQFIASSSESNKFWSTTE